jgi:hypothetical protein
VRAAAPSLLALTTWRQRYFNGPAVLLLLAAFATAAVGAVAALHLRVPQNPSQTPSGEEL